MRLFSRPSVLPVISLAAGLILLCQSSVKAQELEWLVPTTGVGSLTPVGSNLFFDHPGPSGFLLQQVSLFNTGGLSQLVVANYGVLADPSLFAVLGDAVFFPVQRQNDPWTAVPDGIWKYTPSGTGRADPLRIAAGSLTAWQGALYFRGDSGDGDDELWTFDTVNTPQLLKDLNPQGASYPHDFVALSNGLYFIANTGNGDGLFRTNGTSAGTTLVRQLNNRVDWLVEHEGVLYFSHYERILPKYFLWRSDGTLAGTYSIAGFDQAIQSPTSWLGKLFFFEGGTLWVSDGTTHGNQPLKTWTSVNPGLVGYKGHVYLGAPGGSTSCLWRSDGVQTTLVDCQATFVASLHVCADRLYYRGGTGEVWRSDGTGAGTQRVAALSVVTPLASGVRELATFDGDLVFSFWNSLGNDSGIYRLDRHAQFSHEAKHLLPQDELWSRQPVLGDIDKDGDLDLFIANWGQNRLYRNDGHGGFEDITSTHLPALDEFTFQAAFGDVDGDGDLDLALAIYNFGTTKLSQNRLFLNDGTGRFVDGTVGRMPVFDDDTGVVAMADLDRDGDLDLVFGCEGKGSYKGDRLYLNDGKGNYTDATAGRLPKVADWTSGIAAGDVDGDGDLDLVFAKVLGQNRLFLNDGHVPPVFTDATSTNLPTIQNWSAHVVLADVDGDKDLDLVFSGDNQLCLNDGTGVFSDHTASLLPASTRSQCLDAADVDLDGDVDLLFTHYALERQNLLFVNDGSGKFSNLTNERLPGFSDESVDVAFADVDGDGDLDYVVANKGQNRLVFNRHRQVYSPEPAERGQIYKLDLYAKHGYAPGVQFVVPYLSVTEQKPPLMIPPLGRWGLGFVGLVNLPPQLVPHPQGKVSIQFPLPIDPVLAGKSLFTQGFVLHDLANWETWRFSNVNADLIK